MNAFTDTPGRVPGASMNRGGANPDRSSRAKARASVPDDVINKRLAKSYRDLEEQLGEARVVSHALLMMSQSILEGGGRVPIIEGHLTISEDDAEAVLWMIYLAKSQTMAAWNEYQDRFKAAHQPAEMAA